MVKLHYVSQKAYQKKVLEKGKTLFQSDNSIFYKIGRNSILKDYQYELLPYPSHAMSEMLEIWKKALIEESEAKTLPELVKATDLWIVDNMLRGQTMPMLAPEFIDFDDYVNFCGEDLEEICRRFQALNDAYERGTKLNFVFLDSITKGNIKIHKTTKDIALIDGEGIQVSFRFPFIASSLLNIDENQAMTKKYFVMTPDYMYATPNLNRASLLVYFIKLCTKYVSITDVYSDMTQQEALEMILTVLGLEKDDLLAPIIRKLYDSEEIPVIENERFQEFGKAYQFEKVSFSDERYIGHVFKKR